MVELMWPGKENAKALSFLPSTAQWDVWNPASPHYSSGARKESPPHHRLFAEDNLEALRLLREAGQRYDVIYIDPPYNTGSSLTYKDKQTHVSATLTEAWLDHIYPRMLLAREVLKDTGVLFVSIDDTEACHLLTLLREIFGKENHLGTIKWRRKRKPSFLDRHLSATLEYVLVFARDARQCPRLVGKETEEPTRPVLNAANKIVERCIPQGMEAHCADGSYEPGEYRNRSLAFTLKDPLCVRGGRVLTPARVEGPFRIQQDLWHQTGFITRNFGLRRRVLESERKRRHAEDDGTAWPTNEDAQEELRKIFDGQRVFDFPKPVGLLMELLSMVSVKDVNVSQHCLDFYAGSGTFLIAALEQSRRDGIERKVDLVQSREQVRVPVSERFFDIAEICAHRVLVDSQMRGFAPSFGFYTRSTRSMGK